MDSSAFGVVHKAVFDLDTKRAEADAKRAKHDGLKDYHAKIAAGKFVRYEDDVDDEGKRLGAPPAQKAVKAVVKPAAPPKRKRYSGLNPEDRRQRRMKAEQYGMAGGAAGAAATGSGLALVSRDAKRTARRIGVKGEYNERGITRLEGTAQRARTAVDEIGAKAPKYKYTPRVSPVAATPPPLVTTAYVPKPNEPGKGPRYEAAKKAHAEAQIAEHHAKYPPSKPVDPKAAARNESKAKAAHAKKIAANAAQKVPYEQRELRATAVREGRLAQRGALSEGFKVASRRGRVTGRAAVVAGGTALALGAGAAGVRHMRRHQGKTYTDWWDAPRKKSTFA
jgi:hypothetical protein